ncbi:hypothetical protein AFGD_006568 [Aspergillus flavus]|nr:hypothetical protein AFGD_006568 [Aspergillus flavus]
MHLFRPSCALNAFSVAAPTVPSVETGPRHYHSDASALTMQQERRITRLKRKAHATVLNLDLGALDGGDKSLLEPILLPFSVPVVIEGSETNHQRASRYGEIEAFERRRNEKENFTLSGDRQRFEA